MKQGNTLNEAIRLLKGHYYGNIILLTVIFLLILFRIIPVFADRQYTVSVTAERYAIILSIIVIPVSLRFFAQSLKKVLRPSETVAAIRKYKEAFFLRLYPISAIALMHIILFGISRNMNYFWFTVVSLIVFIFCMPSYEELKSLTELPEEQMTEEEKVQPEEGELESGEVHKNVMESQSKGEETEDRLEEL